MTTTADLARNLALAWWPLILTAALVWSAVALIQLDRRLEERRSVRDLAKLRAQVDAKADAAWADILAAVGLTTEDVRAAYERREQTW